MISLKIKLVLYAIGALAVAGLLALIFSLPEHYRKQGREEIRSEVAQKSREALLVRNAENERDKLAQEQNNKEVKAYYEIELQNQAFEFDKHVADIKRTGGLRIAAPACRESTGTPEATSPIRVDEIGDYRLPSDVEEGIFGLVRKCEQVQTKLTALQMWLRLQGFEETKE